ncbi:unnamed protein product [Phaedon cochleariae]|uniref:Tesmin/TSO1-like CXC domain-containing protein n=1 Tax=Phaedon cochleariae TaxID=80249 RepID=A0A9N9SKD2_PHACE|nr:unnamed protein product [Phaedon cochleariae]
MNLNQQLSDIQKQLVLKESLAKQLSTNNQYIVDYQVQELARLIKLKANDELRITKLNQDILQMKQTKVKLVRTMRDESEKFRQWKMQKERECQRLKQQDRKKDNELVKMKVMHDKQQVVFKARVEQAEAVNKRLKNLLALRQQALDAKNTGKADKVEPWYELYMNLVEAEATLNVLLEDRAVLMQQLNELKNAPDSENSEECKSIEEDLELRSAQIHDLQQKLSDSDEEQRSKPFWEKFQTMGEAKFGMKFVCLKAADAQEKNKHQEKCLKEKDEKCAQNLVDLQREYEEKIAILLRRIRGSCDENDEASTYSIQQKKIDQMEEEITLLKEEKMALEDLDNSLSDIDDDLENDPDWRKTPLAKRLLEEKKKFTFVRSALDFDEDEKTNRAPKRSSDGGCYCKTNCITGRCGCKKFGGKCGTGCKCSETMCANRDAASSSSLDASGEEFKKPSIEELPKKRDKKIKTRKFFSDL